MTLPPQYGHAFFPVKYFLSSYRALSDGQAAVRHLEEYLQSSEVRLSDWKVIWIGACAILRASIDLFKVDRRSCICRGIREEIRLEWKSIVEHKEDHRIFWDFLRKERNNILHQYEWVAYETWMDQDGNSQPARLTILSIKPEDVKLVLMMRGGPYKGRNSLELLNESAEWVQARIYSAIRRAGFDPDEPRNAIDFERPPPIPPGKRLLG